MSTQAMHRSAAGGSKAQLWAGRVLTALPVAFLVFDAVVKLMMIEPVRTAMEHLGWRAELAPMLGVILLVCTALYALPATSVLGAVLLTAYFGGAIATHIRVGDPLFSHTLFPLYIALMVWGGIYLRDANLRALIPIRRHR